MPRQRRPVQDLQEALSPQVRPAAQPVQLGPTVAPPPDLPIYDFAAISGTISGYLARQQQKRNQVAVQEGEQFVEENRLLVSHMEEQLAAIQDPAERDRVMKEQFAFLQRNGTVPPMGDPFHRIGYHRAVGRVMAGKYWQALQKRLDEVTLVQDAQGNPVQPVDPEQIMAQEWEKIADSPSVRDYYGGQEALAEKQRADGQFLEKVTARRAQAEEDQYLQIMSSDAAGRFDAILHDNAVVTSETLQPVTDYLTKEFQEHNVLNPREVVLQALELSIRRKAAISPEEAVRAVHAAQDLKVGGVRLGDDRSGVGLRLEELSRQVVVQAKDTEREDLQREDVRRDRQIQNGQADYVPVLLQAKREGQSLMAVADRLEQQYLAEDDKVGRFEGRGAFVVDAMREYALALDGKRRTDGTVRDSLNILIADGDTESARALATSALRRGALTGEDYAGALTAIKSRADVSQYVEGNDTYRSVLSRYKQSAPSGYAGEIQDRLDSESVERERALAQDLAAYAREVKDRPDADALVRDWLTRREDADLKPVRARTEELRRQQSEVIRGVRDRQARYQDASDLIDRAQEEGTLTILAADELRQEDIRAAANKDRLIDQSLEEAGRQLTDSLTVEFGGPPQDQDQVALAAEARRLLRDSLSTAIDGVLADPAADPRTFAQRARAEGQKVIDEVSDKLFPVERKAIKRGLEEGQGAAGTLEEVNRQKGDRALALTLSSTLAEPEARARLQHTDILFAPAKDGGAASLRDPRLPTRFYEYVAAWWSGRDPIFGGPVERENVVDQVRHARVGGLDDEGTLAAMDLVGIDALDVVRGTLVLEPTEDEQARGQEEIARLEAGIRAGIAQPTAVDQVAELRGRISPVRIPLADHQFRPYITPFFRSREAFSAFTDDPAYPEFLRRLGVGEEDREEFEKRQLDAIERSR